MGNICTRNNVGGEEHRVGRAEGAGEGEGGAEEDGPESDHLPSVGVFQNEKINPSFPKQHNLI